MTYDIQSATKISIGERADGEFQLQRRGRLVVVGDSHSTDVELVIALPLAAVSAQACRRADSQAQIECWADVVVHFVVKTGEIVEEQSCCGGRAPTFGGYPILPESDNTPLELTIGIVVGNICI